MKTIQDNSEILQNAKAFLAYIKPTKFLLMPDPRTQTPEQLNVATANSAAFNYWLSRNRTNAEGLTDFSVDAIVACHKALRDAGMIDFTFGTAPVVHKANNLVDSYGRPIRDLRAESAAQKQREAEEAAAPRRSVEQEIKDTEMRIAVNKGIEHLQNEASSFRGKHHADTYRGRKEMNDVIERVKSGGRHLLDISNAADELRRIADRYWKD